MSTIGFIAHALSPSSPQESKTELGEEKPRTVTGNTYSIFTTKNYGDTEMHWFWMVLVCVLLLFAYWKLRRFCQCPGPSKEERRAKREAKWHKHQLDNIERQIEKIREEARGGAQPKKLPGSRWGDSQRALILERCDTELRRLEDYMASEHLALPGSSNVVALSYACLLYTSPSPRDQRGSRMPSSA